MRFGSSLHEDAEEPAVGSSGWAEYVLGFGLGLALLVAGVVWLNFQRDFARRGQRVEGTIIDYIEKAGDSPTDPFERAHYAVFRYQDHLGEQHTRTSSVGFAYGVLRAPVKAEVVYDKRNPEDAQIASAHYFWLMPLGLIAGGLLVIGHGLRAIWRRGAPG